MVTDSRSLSPSGRKVLDVAADAFYSEGVAAVGVDTLAARSGVSKPTLYVQFGSKPGLVAAVLSRRHDEQRASLEAFLATAPAEPVQQLLAVFDWLGQWHAERGRRGCAFLNVAAEVPDPDHPARAVIIAHKHWLASTLTDLARRAGQPDPEEIGYGLLLLIDGANARLLVEQDQHAAQRARRVAARLLGSPTATGPSS